MYVFKLLRLYFYSLSLIAVFSLLCQVLMKSRIVKRTEQTENKGSSPSFPAMIKLQQSRQKAMQHCVYVCIVNL